MKLKLAFTILVAAAAGLGRGAERPNIIFILADDMGWGDLGCYGHPGIRTPHIDTLAGEGTLFTQFYVSSPVCSPSRASFLTGRYPARDGIFGPFLAPSANRERGMPQFLDPKVPNLPTMLRQRGYATAHIGKWHLRNNVSQLVAQEPEEDIGQGPKPSAYGFDFTGSGEPWGGNGPKDDPYYRARSSALFVDEAIGFIRQHRDRPFYVQLWALLPHARLNPLPGQMTPYAHLRAGGSDFPFPSAAEFYYSSVTELDTQVGRLLAALDELGLAENTLVVFASDNGPEDIHRPNAGHSGVGSGGPFRGRKRSLYEGGIRVPFIVRWPGHVPAGRIDNETVLSALDFLPTLGTLTGATVPTDIDGEQAGEAWLGRKWTRQRALAWDWRYAFVGDPIHHSPPLAIREGNWKLLLDPAGRRAPELYILPDDPGELDNVAAEHPEVVRRLEKEARQWRERMPVSPEDPAVVQPRYRPPGTN